MTEKDIKGNNQDKVLSEITNKDIYKNIKNKNLIVHFMVNKVNEVGTTRTKIYNQEVNWKKRLWPIDHTAFITDKKGTAHLFLDINEATGTLRFDKSYLDKCVQCSNKIGQDAVNTRDLLKRKTISALWGIDNSHIMLLLILAIGMVILAGIIMYMYGENQKLTSKLASLVPTPPPNTVHSSYHYQGEVLSYV